MKLGNITIEDEVKLKRYLRKLCHYLSRHYEELKGMSDMTDESFMTDVDIMCDEHEKEMAEKDVQLAEQKNHLIAATKVLIAQGMSEEEARSITSVSFESSEERESVLELVFILSQEIRIMEFNLKNRACLKNNNLI